MSDLPIPAKYYHFTNIAECHHYVIVLEAAYYVRHKAEKHENPRFFSTRIEFAENAYAYVLKAPSRSKPHVCFFCEFICLQ